MRRMATARSVVGLVGLAIFSLALSGTWAADPAAPAAPARWTPTEPPNQPIGEAKGIFPGRVVWMHDPRVAQWDGDTKGSGWLDDKSTDPVRADQMLRKSLRLLSGAKSDAEAWAALFRHFNRTHGRGDAGYRPGERVAVKLNLNCAKRKQDPNHGTLQHAAIDHGAIAATGQAGPRARKPTSWSTTPRAGSTTRSFCLPTRSFPASGSRIRTAARGGSKSSPTSSVALHFGDPSTPDNGKTYLPACVTGATYLINAALLKGHSLAAVTLCAKNHFGSVYREGTGPNRSYQGWSPSNMHDAIMTETRPMGTYNPLVDLMGHKDLGGKTILYLIEGFYAAPHQSVPAQKWQSPPFNGHWTASLFVSQDPVAIESVAVDFFAAEKTATRMVGAVDNYLHEAALANRPPSGTRYDPEGDGTHAPEPGRPRTLEQPREEAILAQPGNGQGDRVAKGGMILGPFSRPR